MKKEGYHSISDLYSDEFLRYIKNQKNILYQSDEDLNELIYDDTNNIKDDIYNDITERKNDKNKNKTKNHEKDHRKINKFTRHQSHPLGENNYNLNLDLSFELKEEKCNQKESNQSNKVDKKNQKEKEKKNEKEKEKNVIENNKNKIKNSEQKNVNLPVYKKPKIKQKKNRNEKRNDYRVSENINGHNNITINIANQTHKNNNNISISNINTKRSKNIKKEKEKEIIISKNKPTHTKNNRSFSQVKKKKPKNDKKIHNLKKKFPEIPKKPENNALKTEIIRKNLNTKMMPICSFHIISKTKEMLNKINNNEEINIDFMNTSFNKKLSDDIKENILKLKNPKKKISPKEKEKKINNALLSLKMKKQRKKGDYNYNKQFNKNKKIKMTVRPPIFRESRKDHTIIHNRNASLCNENRNNNRYKNLSLEKNKNRNDFSFSPNINRHESHERRNIINIYVQNKNNINSNNVYNINLITKNNYSIERASINKNKQNNNYNNIKVKKVKISRQNYKSIEDKFPVNSNNYLNTANMTFNRNRKFGFQTPNKPNQGMYFDKVKQILSNSNIQYQSINNNENKKNSVEKTFNHKSNSVENRYSHKNMYNKSYNDFYNNNNNKKIRINFKPIEEKEIDDLNNSKKIDIGKINSNQKIKKIESKTNNNKRKNNHKAYHYKSRSLMDIDNPILSKNQPKNMNTVQKEKNNYTITDNQKITKIRSTKCASVKDINKNNSINNTLKPKKPLINISFVNLHTNDNKQQTIEPKKYKGPVDFSCLLVGKSLSVLIDKISGVLKRNKISNIFINQYKLRCTKNGKSFDIEFMKLNDNILKANNNSILESSYENDSKYKTITETASEKTANLYYYTIFSKIKNNKNLIKSVSKIINTKFGNFKNKK